MVTKHSYLQGGVIMVGPEIEITLKKKKSFENGRLLFEEHRFRAVEVFHENKLKKELQYLTAILFFIFALNLKKINYGLYKEQTDYP